MFFKQFYLGCLAHASYMIGSEGKAAVVDPQRDVDHYIEEAAEQGLQIVYIVETHLHADFVSGHRELAARTGAEIVFGAKAGAEFPHIAVSEGDELRIGSVALRFLETPGHTPESISVLVTDTAVSSSPRAVLTGDTMFIGDVGRPDLVGSKGYTSEQMASLLYDSLHEKLLTLDDAVEVYPAHGAGSQCGRNISKETSSTIGQQRVTNWALNPMPREEFVRLMTENLPEAPAYFPTDAAINRGGAPALSEIPKPAALSAEEVNKLSQQGVLVLDVRPGGVYGEAHVPGSLNIGLGGQFASWAGTLITHGTPIVIVAEDADGVSEAIVRLARVGIESVMGTLLDGIAAWKAAGLETASVPQITVQDLAGRRDRGDDIQVVDVRRPGEYDGGHVPGAPNVPLSGLEREIERLLPGRPTAVICQSGYRSSAATSILERHGFHEVMNVAGGTSAWLNAGLPAE